MHHEATSCKTYFSLLTVFLCYSSIPTCKISAVAGVNSRFDVKDNSLLSFTDNMAPKRSHNSTDNPPGKQQFSEMMIYVKFMCRVCI